MVKAFGQQVTGSDFVRVRVPNVKVNGQVLSVAFKAKEKFVRVKAKGHSTIKVRPNTTLGKKVLPFEAFALDNPVSIFMGKTPAQAFARAAQAAWV